MGGSRGRAHSDDKEPASQNTGDVVIGFDNEAAIGSEAHLKTQGFDRPWSNAPSQASLTTSVKVAPLTLGSCGQCDVLVHDPADTIASEREAVTSLSTCSAA